MDTKREKYFLSFYNQLLTGINYYRKIVRLCNGFSEESIEDFNSHLDRSELELEALDLVIPMKQNPFENTSKKIEQK